MFVWILLFVIGLLFLLISRKEKRIISIDTKTLYSKKYRLAGRPDMIIKDGNYYIPIEIKSDPSLRDSHIVQGLVYALLIEEEYGILPPYIEIRNQGKISKIRVKKDDIEKIKRIIEVVRAMKEGTYEPSPGEFKINIKKCIKCAYYNVCPYAKKV